MIRFTCSCGRQLQARDERAGQQVRCPECGAGLVVPDPDAGAIQARRPTRPAAPPDDYEDDDRPPRRRPEPRRANTGLIIGLVCGGVAVVAVAVTLLIVLSGGGGKGGRNEAEARAKSSNNLKQITLAMHNYNDTFGRLPPAVVYGQGGKPLYSWRVLLLPFVEEDQRYKQFHFNEPWDSPHNKSLLTPVPKVYAHPMSNSQTDTHYFVFDGPMAAFNSSPQSGGLRPSNVGIGPPGQTFEAGITSRIPVTFTDGTSNTIMVTEAARGVPWTKPEDLPFGPGQPLPKLDGLYSDDTVLVGMADGSTVRIQRQALSDVTLRAAITANGGEVLGADWPAGR